MKTPTLDDLRRHAVARSLFKPTTLPKALSRMGFVQADPLRAPARAQDLALRHRVQGYRAGDLERRYGRLGVEEDFFINYGFMPAAAHALMHPRHPRKTGTPWTAARWKQAEAVLAFVQQHGAVHPRAVDAHFQHGKSKNWFGGNTNASTQLLDGLHYRGLLRVAGRSSGVRTYALRVQPAEPGDPAAALDALVDLVIGVDAPLPELSLNMVVSRLRYGARPVVGADGVRQRPRATRGRLWPGAGSRKCTAGEFPGCRRRTQQFTVCRCPTPHAFGGLWLESAAVPRSVATFCMKARLGALHCNRAHLHEACRG